MPGQVGLHTHPLDQRDAGPRACQRKDFMVTSVCDGWMPWITPHSTWIAFESHFKIYIWIFIVESSTSRTARMGNALSLGTSIAIPLLGGTGIGLSMRDDVKTWFPTIKKPSWQPPNWLFGPVWTVLYTLMGISSWRVYSKAGLMSKPMFLYSVQLVLNFLWSPLFFKWHRLPAASADITALLGVLGLTIVEFTKVDGVAATMLYPYLAWTMFATALTYNITMNNPSSGSKE